jgi:hypothetical protein
LVISLEELQKAGLSASGALHSPEAQVITNTLQVLEVHTKILNPKTAAFSNCGQLSRPENKPKRTFKAQVVEHLPSKCKALSSNTNTEAGEVPV